MVKFSIALTFVMASQLWQPAMAAGGKLGAGIYLGVHRPAMEDLNDAEFKSPIGGFATVLNEAGNNETKRLVFHNPLPGLELGVNAGLEFQWFIDDEYSFLFGGGTWEATSRAVAKGGLYIQGDPADVINERVAKLSYNEFYFGLRRNIIDVDGKYKLYYRLTLNEVFDVDFREDMVFLYTSGKADGVKKTMVFQSQATGLTMLQPGFGADYSLREWLTVGADLTYVIGLKRLYLRDGTYDSNFLPTDNMTFWLPQRVSPATGNLEYLNHDYTVVDDYTPIRLNFDGWKVLFRMNIFF